MHPRTSTCVSVTYRQEPIEVELLGPRIARTVEPGFCLALSADDIVQLNHDPDEQKEIPEIVDILHKRNPILSEVAYCGRDQRDRMIALAAVLGAEVVDISDPDDDGPGIIRIAHAPNFDLRALAVAADVTPEEDEAFLDDEEENASVPVEEEP